jgi:hypothetical protein
LTVSALAEMTDLDYLAVITSSTTLLVMASAVHFKIFGIRIGITVTDTPNGPITCTTVRGPGGKGSSSCTIPV